MDCAQTRDLLSIYQDGALDAGTAAMLAAHLRGCGECAAVAGSLAAVRDRLRDLPAAAAPPELLARVLAAVEAESGDAGGKAEPKPFPSRFRIPLEAAAAILLFAAVYWYQRTSPPPALSPPAPVARVPDTAFPSRASSETAKAPSPGPKAAREESAGARGSAAPVAASRPKRTAPEEEAPAVAAAAKPRTWTAADLPAVPALRASTDSEPIVPAAAPRGPAAEIAATGAGAPAFEASRSGEAEGSADSRPSRVFAAPPSRLLRPLPYGRDIALNVGPEHRDGVEDRIAEAAARLGGIVERIERGPVGETSNEEGTVRVVLPESASRRFLEELGRIGTIPPGGQPAATDLPAGPRAGTVAYAVRIRVR